MAVGLGRGTGRRSLDHVGVVHQFEMISPKPSPPSLLHERQPTSPTPRADRHNADAQELGSLHPCQPDVLGIGRLIPAFALPRVPRALGALLTLGPQLEHLVTVQRRPPMPTPGGELALRDELPDQRDVATK